MTTHTVNMTNNCGFGVPTLDQVPSDTLATGSQSYTNATVQAGAFLNTGYCGPNGGNCTTVDVNMNSTISIVVVDLIPTHVFTVPVGFTYFNGCDGAGVSCLTSDCVNAIRDPSQTSGIVTCSMPGAGVLVTFCPNLDATTSSASVSTIPTTVPAPTTASSSSKTAVIAGAVGGTVGGLAILLIASLTYFFCRRRRRRHPHQGEEHVIEEYAVPAPYSAHPSYPVLASKPNHGSLQNINSPTTIHSDYSGAASPPPQQSGGVRPLPLPPQSPNSTSSGVPPSDVGGSPRRIDLDRIIEGLAERFGWTAPPPGMDSLPPPGRPLSGLPEYR
ncbi:hypothetical protein PAXRUDRAFT_826079 [Paxillus rubicundulus Ve08.2h10]|uniref:Uncharacterized protein n=1 Tax=Paxillus rubicundulus Ve08.2h10 TaxID=930991 RepID=A0A0D0DZY3_9AGAM|nr:hypothetical protein PAXRUDRAFT_826079 [Paxillus rubicundulus Ve08.2h10]